MSVVGRDAEQTLTGFYAPAMALHPCTCAGSTDGVRGFEKEHVKWGEKSRGDVGKELVRKERVGFYQNILYVYRKFSNNKSNEKNVNKKLKASYMLS